MKIIYPSGCQHRAHPGKLIQREYGKRKFKQHRNIYAFRRPLVRHVSTRNCACAVTLPRVPGKIGSGTGRQDRREPDVFIDV